MRCLPPQGTHADALNRADPAIKRVFAHALACAVIGAYEKFIDNSAIFDTDQGLVAGKRGL